MFAKIFISILICLFPSLVNAQPATEMTLSVATTASGAEARQMAFDQATEMATARVMEGILGSKVMPSIWEKNKRRILNESSRYVLFIKASQPRVEQGLPVFDVQLRISSKNLESLLRETGLLTSGPVQILPLFEVLSEDGRAYAWWADDNLVNNSREIGRLKTVVRELMGVFKGSSIMVLDPTQKAFQQSIPAVYRSGFLRKEDQMALAGFLKTDLVLSGSVEVVRAGLEGGDLLIKTNLELWRARTGRVLGRYNSDVRLNSINDKAVLVELKKASARLMGQLGNEVKRALQTGEIHSNVVRVEVKGELSHPQLTEFKKGLMGIRQVKTLVERLIEADRVVYLADVTVPAETLVEEIKKQKWNGFKVGVSGSEDSIFLRVSAGSPPSVR